LRTLYFNNIVGCAGNDAATLRVINTLCETSVTLYFKVSLYLNVYSVTE